MAEVTIKLVDRGVNGRDITVELTSDPDALPHEHEREHKDILEKLMGKGIIKDGDKVTVTRGGQVVSKPQGQTQENPAQRQAQHA